MHLVGTSIVFLLPAIIIVWVLTGSLDFAPNGVLKGNISNEYVPFLLALFAFGIGKAALMPFHKWLPAAMVAPTPVSALLHAVAVVKAGVFSMLVVITYVFGIDFLTECLSSERCRGTRKNRAECPSHFFSYLSSRPRCVAAV